MNLIGHIKIVDDKVYYLPSFLNAYGVNHNEIEELDEKYKYELDLIHYETIFRGYGTRPDIELYFDYTTISQKLVKKYSIPSENDIKRQYFNQIEEFKKIHEERKRLEKEEKQKRTDDYISMKFEHYYKRWKEAVPIYNVEFLDKEKIENYCKNHFLLYTALCLKEEKKLIRDIYKGYMNYPDLIFKSKNYQSFGRKLREIGNENGIKNSLLHNLKNRISNNFKLTEDVLVEIRKHYSNPKKLNSSQILEKVNNYLTERNRRKIALSTVQGIIADPYIKNKYMKSRFGKKFAQNNLVPYSYFNPPKENGVLWEIDGTRLQFLCKYENGEINRLSFFVVLDAYSKKIIGYSFGNSENTEMIIDALRMACLSTKYLPSEILHDNASSFSSERMIELISYSKLLGTIWRSIRVGNSRDNGYVERFFGVFQESFCKKCNGYFGDGIKSKNPNGRPAPEELEKYSKKGMIRTKEELIELIVNLINQYNKSRRRKKKSPNELSSEESSKHIIKLNTIKYVQLFWPKREITVRNSAIIFTVHKELYRYNIYSSKIGLKVNGTKVMVRYNPEKMTKILIFDLKTDQYLTTLNQFKLIPKAQVERDVVYEQLLQEHNIKVAKFNNDIDAGIKETHELALENTENKPPEITEFIPSTKKEIELTADSEILKTLNELDSKKENKDKKKSLPNKNRYTQIATLKIVS